MLLLPFLFACADQTCEPVISGACALMEVCVTCDAIGCKETIETLRTGEVRVCDGRDRNGNGIEDCWDFARQDACP